ncbi:hypothetical protein O3M35_010613 [Rhynocoris fuscipes]|uniref:YkgJ family cysteine cluster protein n=1 Tax=Rhynocoris fuscipes TaxID=488301 RepID=A0AAW1CZL8_9HEMI
MPFPTPFIKALSLFRPIYVDDCHNCCKRHEPVIASKERIFQMKDFGELKAFYREGKMVWCCLKGIS